MNKIFERDFDQEIELEHLEVLRKQRACYTPEDLNEAVERARKEGFDAGRGIGRQEAAAEAAETDRLRKVKALEEVASGIDSMFRTADEYVSALEKQVLSFVLAVFEKIVPEVMDTRARVRAETEVRAALAVALGTSGLRIYLSPVACEEMAEKLEESARQLGHNGRVEISPDPELELGDARVEWDNGFMQYSFGLICERILTALRAAALLPEGEQKTPADESKGHGPDEEKLA